MAVTHTISITLDDIPPAVSAYAIATEQPISIEVAFQPDSLDWAIRFSLPFDVEHETRNAALQCDISQSGGDWNCAITPDLETANDLVAAFISDQEARYPGLVIVGP